MSFAWDQNWFSIANALVLPFWLLLFFAPRSKLAVFVFERARVSPLHLLALIYALVAIPALAGDPGAFATLARPSLAGVQDLLSGPSGASAGWIHYLCFDLFVGIKVREAALVRGHQMRWVSPVLVLVLMLGPLGWLVFEAVSMGLRARKSI